VCHSNGYLPKIVCTECVFTQICRIQNRSRQISVSNTLCAHFFLYCSSTRENHVELQNVFRLDLVEPNVKPLRPVLYLKNLEIFPLCYPKLEKKISVFFSSFFGANPANFFCEVNLEFFIEVFISQFFSLSFTSMKSQDFLYRISRAFFSIKTSFIYHHLSLCICFPLIAAAAAASVSKKMMHLKRTNKRC